MKFSKKSEPRDQNTDNGTEGNIHVKRLEDENMLASNRKLMRSVFGRRKNATGRAAPHPRSEEQRPKPIKW